MEAAMDMDIGISKENREAIAEKLSAVLADTYMLYLKTHAYHWNVTGPYFSALHLLFETQYNELHDASDGIAERIRALGHFAPGSYATFARLTSIPEGNDTVPEAMTMVRNLASGHEALGRTLRSAFKTAEAGGDQATMDLLIGRMEASDKAAWMLRAHLETPSSETLPKL
jgi:starvation-inducible DNA-binding protein